ncbi:PorT family protein [Fulvivirga maritima]|uniref:outer membrane beta-barrel protein n=1 Tax=Fulvivirga maritima TaxID=2904247 RepID=UPI001F2C132E|nr:outer membrane beta-barrel protein [Fulvivirga maritima]UII28397.1 PorT family protein [Fulvivirga maritima]
MRKKLLILLFFFISYGSYAQVELGFKFTPTISSSRLNSDSDDFNYSSDGVGIRFAAGPFADFAFRENYYFSTGVFLVSNRSAFEITDKNNTVRYKEEYGVQYIQIPVAIKLYTNEIALDKRIYFQVGTTMEFNVKEKEKEEEYFVVENFRFFNVTLWEWEKIPRL